MKTVLPDDRQNSLVQWVSQATGINTFGVKVRLLGNDLHILCENAECPQRWQTLSELLQALQQTDVDTLINDEQPSIYQVLIYGRKKGEHRPEWCHRVYLNQLERHLEQVEQALLAQTETPIIPGGSLIISNESLARQGDGDAIARYLSEHLSHLGIAIQVKIKPCPAKDNSPIVANRLWVFCQSSYSPDPSLLAETVAQKLRHLQLVGYQDAIIVAQVRGELEPDWRVRVDLTPPEVMLKEWARWGDVQAIARILTEELLGFKIALQTSLKESTLHIFCTPAFDPLETAAAPDKTIVLQAIVPLLESIAPQAIISAAIYGQKTTDKQPTWIDWVSLPASEHPFLLTSALELARTGDQPAIIFLLERLLNPNLDWRLKTGGIRVLLICKEDLLHIMCDAPVCPTRHQVSSKVTQFIRQLKIFGITGVRVYGRRAGDKEPLWHHGVDLEERSRSVPEATPEFAATSEYVSSLMIDETSEEILRPDLTNEKVKIFIKETAKNWVLNTNKLIRNLLLNSQLFTQSNQEIDENPDNQGIGSGMIWLALGLLLTLQSDFMLGYVVAHTVKNLPKNTNNISSPLSSKAQASSLSPNNQKTSFLNQTGTTESLNNDSSAFNASGFINDDNAQSGNLPAGQLKEKATSTAILLAARSQMPSFNARQLDEQLALYKQRLATKKRPPDVLIVGSSRALRGVDPVALSKALASQNHSNIDIFNFGINGATAQVVDVLIRQILEPQELPKVILWADGSRAFNNGREDITFNTIETSPGYKQILQESPTKVKTNQGNKNPEDPTEKVSNKPKTEDTNIYQTTNDWLNQSVANLSASYKNRDQIKILLQKQLQYLPFSYQHSPVKLKVHITHDSEIDNNSSLPGVDFDGFLPLSIRYNPTTYYQQHPKVSGDYDNDYKSFQLVGKQDQAFHSMLEFTKNNNISLIFVNMPLTADYLDPVRTKYEQQFQEYLLTFTNYPQFIYRDLSQLWPTANDYFSDPSHLNRYGAYEVSKKLAIDPMISWPTK
ncbi:DUF1574 domain-containing protein [Dolichospermum sp. LEGE 00240]|jgi:hypothetical protein|uniref:DUF1574 domain-containing protein n=1 Tax=Dolichospermum sp. LEGE 00240 TaxID=1828603 RepID=UPI0018821028|nr:DUF1574 domain-containing protein [Dolichospermum sp. LEGE 00240]MBE9251100.1 DUF1574 domain-containing protein [Dolichospermum sp. LEGE 00240]MDM3851064.1 DUF1574 domain-containing protein [Aphanizomenon gracile PMC627.10]MDM3855853.1 DUF1574 domain-containing protein [Aphanizomenon gracile PMC649.10]